MEFFILDGSMYIAFILLTGSAFIIVQYMILKKTRRLASR